MVKPPHPRQRLDEGQLSDFDDTEVCQQLIAVQILDFGVVVLVDFYILIGHLRLIDVNGNDLSMR